MTFSLIRSCVTVAQHKDLRPYATTWYSYSTDMRRRVLRRRRIREADGTVATRVLGDRYE